MKEEMELRQAANVIGERYGARVVQIVTGKDSDFPQEAPLDAECAWVALYDARFRMASVALSRYRAWTQNAVREGRELLPFAEALETLFPEPMTPARYLLNAVRSVLADERRRARVRRLFQEMPSLDAPLVTADGILSFQDLMPETRASLLPETWLLETANAQEGAAFTAVVQQALVDLSENHYGALQTRLERLAQRHRGERPAPATAPERQRLNQARKALRRAVERRLATQGMLDNAVYDRLFRNSPAPKKINRSRRTQNTAEPWNAVRQESLYTRLLETTWTARAARSADGAIEQAITHELNADRAVVSPDSAMRQAVRVMDRYAIRDHRPQSEEAADWWDTGRQLRKEGRIEEAVAAFRACAQAEPTFVEAQISVGVGCFRLGRLAEAQQIYLDILKHRPAPLYTCIAASNLSEIYLTWFLTGRGEKERNIALALRYARQGMELPSPARFGNLLLVYLKDGRRFVEARALLHAVLAANHPDCPPDKLLTMLFRIEDPDLILFWKWLDATQEEKGQ